MRLITLVTGTLIACAAMPAVAASKGESWKPTYAACEALAVERGVAVNDRRTGEGPSPFRQFMVACLAGKVEGKPVVAARVAPAAQIPGRWDNCEQLAMKRGIDVNERGRGEGGPSPWRQFMVACLAGKVEGKAGVAARSVPVAEIPGRWDSCEQLALKRGIDVNERGRGEGGPSPWRQFMVSCLAGKTR
jgi:hypothetical protein